MDEQDTKKINVENTENKENLEKKPTPGRCLVGATLSGGLAYMLYWLTIAIANTYATLNITSTNPIVINLSTAIRTIVIGMTTLATTVFGIVTLGLVALAIQLTIQGIKERFSAH